jgi:phosphomannomutase
METMDGIKFFLDNPAAATKKNAAETWLLLRASGTEPLLRVYCESCAVESVTKVLEGARAFVLAGRAD